ncbi:MAG: ROK family protein [Salinivirgaceae bacterium]|jgi:glucokinase|nr:ROK family protein [Salinivirgaceae bacterium]
MIKLAVGIDIGGTNTAIGLVDRSGKVFYQTSIPSQTRENVEDYVFDLYGEIEKAKKTIDAEFELIGIGIGAPNANYYTGTIEEAPNLRWKGIIHFTKLFEKYYDVPIFITNDANAAAIGEMVYGGAKGMKNFVVITLGTGLGSGIVVNGKLLYGHDGFAGELGHIIVDANGRKCNCGRNGCLETYVSATGVVRTVFETLAYSNEPSELRGIPFTEMTSKRVAEATKENDPIALETIKKTARMLGEAIADITAITSPEAVFLFGGLTKSGRVLFDQVQYYKEKNMLSIFSNKTKLLSSQLGDDSAILGSSGLVWSEIGG